MYVRSPQAQPFVLKIPPVFFLVYNVGAEKILESFHEEGEKLEPF
jgi:hypothetical protein